MTSSDTNGGIARISFKDILAKKHCGDELTEEDLALIVQGALKKYMEPVQIGSFLTSVYLKGLTLAETTNLTSLMKSSGTSLDWPDKWSHLVVDKHSTGGVGDKISLPLAPALAACGFKVPMISGRGLAHTGGTLDKLESIPGYNVSLTQEQMVNILDKVGCFIAGQTGDICPADKLFYAYRDATSTVSEQGLITSSIVSKKAAENLQALILDVKIGDGAFMKTIEEGRRLAQSMVDCSTNMGIHTRALLTNMDTPIGNTSGNALEIAETLQCLKGQGPADLVDLVVELGANLLHVGKHVSTVDDGKSRIRESLNNGSALCKFGDMIQKQGVSTGHAQILCNPNGDVWTVLDRAPHHTDVAAKAGGFIESIAAMPIAETVQELGGGRDRPGEPIDHRVGVELLLQLGDPIAEGKPWVRVHHSQPSIPGDILTKVQSALKISESPVKVRETRVLSVVNPSDDI